jgi:hypothetical protein
LADLARWPDVEPLIVERIEEQLRNGTPGNGSLTRKILLDIGENRPLKTAIFRAFFAFDDELSELVVASDGG